MTTFSKPHTVTAVSVSATEFMMLVPPYIEQHGSNEDKALAKEILRITKEIRVFLGQFFLFTPITRSKEFANTCNMSDAKEGAAIVVGSLMRAMVVTIAALFDDDARTSNIPKMVRTALNPVRCEFSFMFHKHYGVEAAAQTSRERLV